MHAELPGSCIAAKADFAKHPFAVFPKKAIVSAVASKPTSLPKAAHNARRNRGSAVFWSSSLRGIGAFPIPPMFLDPPLGESGTRS